jgi:hypothetical protein
MVFTFLLMLIGMDFLWAQQADTLYIYETVIEYDTLINRDTLFVHDTVHLSQTPTEKSRKDYHQKQKSDRKQHEESPVLEELFLGFHLGYIGQFDLMMPAELTEDSRLISVPRVGGHAGLEFSYHFARWFGVSAALNYGTTGALRLKFYWQDGNPETIKRNYIYGTGLSMPIKFEFHYPISPKAWAIVDAGVRIRMPWNTFIHGYDRDYSALDTEYHLDYVEQLSQDNPLILNYNYIDRDILNLDILAGVGMYFRLRNNDLLRWNVGLNAALRQFAIGSFVHRIYNAEYNDNLSPQEDEFNDLLGDFSLRNHFFYAQIAYIHTFKNSKQRQETAPYALKYGNNKMYNHEFKLEASDWFGVLFMQTHWLHLPTGSEVSYDSPEKISPVISGSYYYRVTPWFWVGLSMNYAHYTKNIKVRYAWDDPSAMRVEGTRSYHLLGIMPDIRFSYLNRPHVTLYSGLSIGVNLHIPGKYEGNETYKDYYPDPLFYSAFQATLFGVKAGGSHWFGSFELGAGYKGIASLGVGYEF